MITADRMEAEQLGSQVHFAGNVVLKKGNMTLSSDSMIVYYDAGTKSIREIDSDGDVRVDKDGRIALADKATYYRSEEKIVLTGDARIIENENQIGGKKITLFTRDDRSIVEGGKVTIYQDAKDAAAQGKNRRNGTGAR